jgi:hypothetical protein
MTRELSMVLLGAGLLTTGYFVWPEQDFDKKLDEQAAKRVGGNANGNGRTRSGGSMFIFIHSSGTTSARPAMASVSKGGFGSIGGRVGGGIS